MAATEANLEGSQPTGKIDLESIENGSLELLLCESDTLYDGRFAKNVWLQELPQSITKIVWDNAALMSPRTAEKLKLRQSDKTLTDTVRIVVDGQQVDLPVFLMPGLADGTIVTQLGYGRVCRDEAVSSDEQVRIGQDLAHIRRLDRMHLISGVEVRPIAQPYKLATTQDHFAIDDIGQQGIAERVGRLVREGPDQITEGRGVCRAPGYPSSAAEIAMGSRPMEKFGQGSHRALPVGHDGRRISAPAAVPA